ncbi:hypothetical protein [Litoreibacter roseus]|uniref:Uncharacterized protein n=1 Tax=Litoreibacter roseus TaxID=2601869 RepID=A0A6N6JMX4_9RHOB|nr:hypothetical protein [Litoreibacter roseus]GFE67387.1 hypothetical protein KIN_44610 [Litoreibacter roseus]
MNINEDYLAHILDELDRFAATNDLPLVHRKVEQTRKLLKIELDEQHQALSMVNDKRRERHCQVVATNLPL